MRIFILTIIFLSSALTSSHADLRNGLVGWWKFDEASGNVIDSTGRGHTGTVTGTTVISNCKRGSCRGFNGTSDSISLANTSAIRFTGDGTMSAFVYLDSSWSASGFIMIKNTDQSGTGHGMYLTINTTRNPGINIIHTDGGAHQHTLTSTTAISLNEWVLVTGVWQTPNLLIYINGINTDTSNVGSGTLRVNTSGPGGGIGANNNSSDVAPTSRFNGRLDDVRLYNRALTTQEVKDLYMPGVVIANGVVANGKIDQ